MSRPPREPIGAARHAGGRGRVIRFAATCCCSVAPLVDRDRVAALTGQRGAGFTALHAVLYRTSLVFRARPVCIANRRQNRANVHPQKALDGATPRLAATTPPRLASADRRQRETRACCCPTSSSRLERGSIMVTLQVSAQNQLRQLVEQIERLEEEKKALAADIRDKYAEAKALGFDIKVMRKIISLRKKSKTDRQEEEAVLATYMHALGMLEEITEPQVMDAAE